jgi:hypothetical protein
MKKHVLTLLAVISISAVYAQLPSKKWEGIFKNTTGATYFEDIDLTRDGNYVAAGYTSGSLAKALAVKINADGEEIWKKDYAGNTRSQFNSVATMKDGNIAAVGITFRSGYSDNNVYVVKINPDNGEVIWEKSFGGTSQEYAFSVSAVADGGIIVGGATSSTDGDISGALGNLDAWVLKLDTNGELEWSKILGGENNDQVNKIEETSDHGFILTGYKSPCCHYYADKSLNTDIYVAKLSATGAVEWDKIISGSSYEIGKDIIQTSDGGYLLGAEVWSNDGDFNYNAGVYDTWAIKLETDGTIEWKKWVTGSSNGDYATGVAEVSDGYFIAGYTIDNYTLDRLTTISKYNLDGTFNKSVTVADSAYSSVTRIKAIPSGSFVYAGRMGKNNSSAQAYVAKYGEDNPPVMIATSITNATTHDNPVTVYPNPASDVLHVSLTNPSEIKITDLLGETILIQKGIAGNNVINISHIHAGLYTLHTENGPAKKVLIAQ